MFDFGLCLVHLVWLFYNCLWLSDWYSGKAPDSHRCDLGLIPDIGMWDGYVVAKSDGWVSYVYSGFLQHEDYTKANIGANKHDK